MVPPLGSSGYKSHRLGAVATTATRWSRLEPSVGYDTARPLIIRCDALLNVAGKSKPFLGNQRKAIYLT